MDKWVGGRMEERHLCTGGGQDGKHVNEYTIPIS